MTFVVEGEDSGYTVSEREWPEWSVLRRYASSPDPGADVDHRLFLTRRAFGDITDHVGWGEDTEGNQVEQGGLLVGSAHARPDGTGLWAVARRAVAGRLASGSMSHLRFGHDAWGDMIARVNRLEAEGGDEPHQVIGWYHTHPRDLSVFFSSRDLQAQRRMFYRSWHFAVVLNPQKEVWRVFRGEEADECLGFVVEEARGAEGRTTSP